MCATVSGVSVQIATLQPSRAAAYAASHPACPAPITMTSKVSAINSRYPLPQRTQRKYKEDAQENKGSKKFFVFSKRNSVSSVFLRSQPLCFSVVCFSFPDTEAREDVAQQIFRRALAGHFLQRDARVVQICQHEFFGHGTAGRIHRFARPRERLPRALEKRCVTHVRHGRRVARSGAAARPVQRSSQPTPQRVESFARFGRHRQQVVSGFSR